jgi:hypothetical protein
MRTQFMAVKIPVAQDDDNRLHLREDKIDQALRSKSLGSVLGWLPIGMGLLGATGLFVGSVLLVREAKLAVEARSTNCRRPRRGGVPAGTEIHYGVEGISFADITPPRLAARAAGGPPAATAQAAR